MTKRKKGPASIASTNWQMAENAFDLYRNSLHWYEMMAASATTIGLRLSGIHQSLQNNEIPDPVEMLKMVTEKNQAMMKSTSAANKWRASALKPYPWPQFTNPWQAFDFGSSAASDMMAQNAQWSKMMLNGFSRTMSPFHSASTANAARLTRKTSKK